MAACVAAIWLEDVREKRVLRQLPMLTLNEARLQLDVSASEKDFRLEKGIKSPYKASLHQ
jgi:hypothetical protein